MGDRPEVGAWLKAYQVIMDERERAPFLVHIPCNERLSVGMLEYDPVTKDWSDAGNDSLMAFVMCATSHELECY